MNKHKLLARIMNNQKNVKYSDFVTLLNAFGFVNRRSEGSHNIYKNCKIARSVNAQNKISGEKTLVGSGKRRWSRYTRG